MAINEEKIKELTKLDAYLKSVDLDSKRRYMDEEIKNLDDQKNGFISQMDCPEEIRQSIIDKIESMDSKYLEQRLRDDKFVKGIFTYDNEPVSFKLEFKSPAKELEFKRSFISWLHTSHNAVVSMNAEFDKYEKEIDDLSIDLKEATTKLSDNILMYIDYLKNKAQESGDEKVIKTTNELARYMTSAYNMEVFKEILEKNPSIAKHCVEDLNNETKVSDIGARYMKKLSSAGIHTNLIQYASNEKNNSFEELHLFVEDYEYKDLFVFSLIRYFAMADWNNTNIKRLHATLYLVLKQIYNNTMDIEVRKMVLDNVREYLKLFN